MLKWLEIRADPSKVLYGTDEQIPAGLQCAREPLVEDAPEIIGEIDDYVSAEYDVEASACVRRILQIELLESHHTLDFVIDHVRRTVVPEVARLEFRG